MRRRFINNHKTFDYSKYMTIEALEDGYEVHFNRDVEYNLNGHKWMSLKAGLIAPTLKKGDLLSLRCSLMPGESFGRFFGNGKAINLRGNILSLIFKDDINLDISRYHGVFYETFYFYSGNNIVSVEKNFLPATTLADSCYNDMFSGCTSLTTVPELPATTLASNCYQGMFSGCTSLTVAPELPATILANYCYYFMFDGCTSLTTAPALPAIALANGCYAHMFDNCTSLTTAPELPATALKDHCYNYMFSGTNVLPDCSNIDFTSSTVVATGGLIGLFANTKVSDSDLNRILPKNSNGKYWLPATTLADSCYEYMFSGCTSLTTAPSLPATTLADGCYNDMFSGCTKLNYIKMLATDISASNCLNNWVYKVASTGTFVKNSAMTSLTTGAHGIPSGWTVVNDGEWSGEKIVNRGVAVIIQGSKSVDVQLEFEFPCASTLTVTVHTDLGGGHFGVTQGNNYSQSNFMGRFVSLSFSPQEDDTYIYEVVIEQ